MFIAATKIKFLEDVAFEMTFQDGKVIRYDMSKMFSKYPQLMELREKRELFENGKLDIGGYAVVWNDNLDFSASSVYECGELVGVEDTTLNQQIGVLLTKSREEANLTQTELARIARIDQGDISKIERGLGNPTIAKINKLFHALGKQVVISLK